jgi:SAM-dependent methyltransferase
MNKPKCRQLSRAYEKFYERRNPRYVYPAEFVVRAYLGNYPRHKTDAKCYAGGRVLDLGFGDGRNMPFLHNLGMRVFGVELSQHICDLTEARMRALGVPIEARVGTNRAIPFEDGFFDTVLACHSCYYVDQGSQFEDNVAEVARVLKVGGNFVFSAPTGTSYLLQRGEDIGDGHVVIAKDPYGMRQGSIVKKFESEAEIKASFSSLFTDFAIGCCRNDFWGIEEHVWIVVCTRLSKHNR